MSQADVQPTALILGANGRLGLAAAQAFAAAGWRVLAQTRRPLDAAMPRAAVRLDHGLDDTAALAAAGAGARVVVYGVNPLYTNWDTQMLPLARHGMAVAERLGATFMLPGNVYNFGADMPALLREDTPERPTTQKGRLRCALEAELAARQPTHGLRSVVLRAGDFYGGAPGSWFDQAILASLAKGKLVYPGPLDVAHNWAYLPDLARAFVALAEAPDLAPCERFHFAGHTLTGQQLLNSVEAAAVAAGVTPRRGAFRRSTLPWAVIRALAWARPMWRELLTMEYLWRVPHALGGSRLERAVGPLRSTTPRDAVAAAVAAHVGAMPRRPSGRPATAGV